MLTDIKARFQRSIEACAAAFLRAGLTPNAITLLALFLAGAAALLYYSGSPAAGGSRALWVAAALALLASGFMDALDGAVARVGGRVTPFGAFLDSLLDRYADALVIFGITLGYGPATALFGLPAAAWGLLATFGSINVSYSRARAESLGVQLSGVGIAERPERLLIIVAATFLLNPMAGVVAVAALSNVTVAQRALYVYRRLHHSPGSKNG